MHTHGTSWHSFCMRTVPSGIETRSGKLTWEAHMDIGPVEYIVIEFPGNQFRGEILPALKDLLAKGTIRVIDLIVIKKDADSNVQWFEAEQLGGSEAILLNEMEGEVDDILNAEDIELVAQTLAPNSTAGLLVWEDVWAKR